MDLQGTFGGAGAGGIVELVDWDGTVVWSYVVANDSLRQHHDVHPMPNGNVLILCWEYHTREDMEANGIAANNFVQQYWSERIIEVNPTTHEVVWQWRAWDHLVQDVNPAALNFGDVAASPGRIDLNYNNYSGGSPDWLHANALDYNPERDQVMINLRNMNEIWIIDHSTTTAEAATSSGGNSGKGGDILWRWGSPETYRQGTTEDTQLFAQHDAQWIDDFVDENYAHYGAIAVFNNLINFSLTTGISRGQIITPAWDAATNEYGMDGNTFLPATYSETFQHPASSANYSPIASSIQVMGDGHVLMCAARQGRSFELDEAGNLVWEYRTPLRYGFPVAQGQTISVSENFTFQMERYPEDFPAFTGRDLTSKGFIELFPNEDYCTLTDVADLSTNTPFSLFPNPAKEVIYLQTPENQLPMDVSIYHTTGQMMKRVSITQSNQPIDLSALPAGGYYLKGEEGGNKAVIFTIVKS
ncbi:MAG: aryl-sulfate sulfotransferase [Saprospiraceae bacterium]